MTAGLAALVLAASGAPAYPGDGGVVTNPVWIRHPVSKTAADFPPCHGDRMFTPGAATLDCRLDGRLYVTDCVVVSETPWDCSYGAAAQQLVKRWRVRALDAKGRRVAPGSHVTIPVRFKAPDS